MIDAVDLDSDETLPTFTVLRTTQADGYEDEALPPTDEELLAGPLLHAARGDAFASTARKGGQDFFMDNPMS